MAFLFTTEPHHRVRQRFSDESDTNLPWSQILDDTTTATGVFTSAENETSVCIWLCVGASQDEWTWLCSSTQPFSQLISLLSSFGSSYGSLCDRECTSSVSEKTLRLSLHMVNVHHKQETRGKAGEGGAATESLQLGMIPELSHQECVPSGGACFTIWWVGSE